MLKKIGENEQFNRLKEALKAGDSVLVQELWNSPKALTASFTQEVTGKNLLILTGASQEEAKLFHDFAYFTQVDVVDFPAWESLPSDQVAPSPDIVGDRYKVLQALSVSNTPKIILSSLHACLQKLIPPSTFKEMFLTLSVGLTLNFDSFIKQLDEMGYRRSSIASDKGEFAIRGGIIDVYPVSSPDPYRIEFWGDEIESLRIYDPVGQKSVKQMQSLEIPPAQEMELLGKNKKLATILDYLGPNTIVIFDDLLSLEDRYSNLMNISEASPYFCTIHQFLDQLDKLQTLYWTEQPIEELSDIKILDKIKGSFYSEDGPLIKFSFEMFDREFVAKKWSHPFTPVSSYLLPENEEPNSDELFQSLAKLSEAKINLQILSSSTSEESTFKEKLLLNHIVLPKHAEYKQAYLSTGFFLKDPDVMVLPLTEFSHRYKIRRQKQRSSYHSVQVESYNLVPGEMIVHLNHGIGKYLGIEKRPNHNGVLSEFFLLEYADNGRLFVPLNQSYLISKYIGASDDIPKMHTIGSTRWKHAKEKTEHAILDYARDLLELYAQRSTKPGFVYSPDSLEMRQFEEEFPFVESEDQMAAIQEIKRDMVSDGVMDRLVCGDVGYGKTEVAMRAAFKAVLDGQKQVAVLVPTTVLAMQHYDNFKERMANFAVNIEVVSRFRTAKEIKATLKALEEGKIDILIGTHRIISDDVIFKDLGLLIIDEEQRFGVRAKEHLKKFKVSVDCLTLSATPIPRTLYMSLVGARDMSVISTPPQDRLPINTIISEPQEQIIKNALLRELTRNGQAFYIHNRVETIYDVVDYIKKLLPQVRVTAAHGQMHADEIDQVFHSFKRGDIDVLVATTIVENGIDIPNANTILIDRADHFGMADLYQLRGRVGRWNRRAYAYFLVKRLHMMTEISRKRLSALAESSGYGGGMKVAMRDLEIRGAGNILGLEQSGFVSAIGFHLYCKLLKRTVQAFQGKIPIETCDTKIETPIDARIPEDYVSEVTLRMEFYQKLGEAMSWEDCDEIWKELLDRFGKPPLQVQWLYYLTRIRVFAALKGISQLKLEKLTVMIERKINKQTITKRLLIGQYKDPQDLETRIVNAINKDN